ncbi:MAG: cell division protein FtsH, partial [Burkholderiaceae bacterium]
QYQLAKKLIIDNREKVEAMTKALLELETIDADQINDIVEGKPPRPPKPPSSSSNTPTLSTTSGSGAQPGATAPA